MPYAATLKKRGSSSESDLGSHSDGHVMLTMRFIGPSETYCINTMELRWQSQMHISKRICASSKGRGMSGGAL